MNNLSTDKQKEIRAKRKREIKRDNIIKFAEQAFIEHGYENTMVDQVALDCGYTKATLYNYFESKEDLLIAVLSKAYGDMHDALQVFLEKNSSTSGIRTVGDAYLHFVEQYPEQAKLLDSGRCVTINRNIIQKEENEQNLSESEQSFKTNETKAGKVILVLLTQSIAEYGLENKVEPLKLLKILGAFMPVIRELVRRGNVAGQSKQEIRATLSILFNIIEQGVKHYE